MAQPPLSAVLRHVHSLIARHDAEQMSDRQLLQRFAAQRDEVAFAALLRRLSARVAWPQCSAAGGGRQGARRWCTRS